MNQSYHNQPFFETPESSFQSYPNTPSQVYTSFPIVQESPSQINIRRNSNSNNESTAVTTATTKLSELKFKIESVGVHPEDDDDLDMCPARVRPGWPEKIIPWWIPMNDYEKPPYSYATLIAHAILSSKDGRLTLSDIYLWISNNYPTFVLGVGGWQNSIRHNLSLNKKWFLKIDRRPTQANPGKGCYWTLVAGTEHIFIDNLTQEGGHNRKQHDIGLTTELSMGQRRGACFYNSVGPNTNSLQNNNDTMTAPTPTVLSSGNPLNSENQHHGLATPPLTPTKPELSRPLLSPLYTTFRMISEKSRDASSLYKKRPRKRLPRRTSSTSTNESEYDSGVDLGSEYVEECENVQKRRRCHLRRTSSSTLPLKEEDGEEEETESLAQLVPCDTPISDALLTDNILPLSCFSNDTATTTAATSAATTALDWEQNPTAVHTTTMGCHPLYAVEKPSLQDNNNMLINPFPQMDTNYWSQPWSIMSVPDENVVYHNDPSFFSLEKRYPITIDLGGNNDTIEQKYLPFRQDDTAFLQSYNSSYNLYPTSSSSHITPYVSMQDILYS